MDERIEVAARAAHAHNNSGVDRRDSQLSWETEQRALKRWHLAMAEASLAALDAQPRVQCDDTECYVRWQDWNAARDMQLEHAIAAEAALEVAQAENARLRSDLESLVTACREWAGDESSDGQPLLPRRVARALSECASKDTQ